MWDMEGWMLWISPEAKGPRNGVSVIGKFKLG